MNYKLWEACIKGKKAQQSTTFCFKMNIYVELFVGAFVSVLEILFC